jgi:hypothetical protein
LGGVALGGLGSALGQGLSRHPSLGGAIKSGITGGAEAYGGSHLLSAIGRGGGLSGAGGAGGSAAANPSSAYLSGGGITGSAPASLFGAASGGGAPGVSSAGLGGLLGGGAPVGGGVGLSSAAMNFAPESNALLAGTPGIASRALSTATPMASGGLRGALNFAEAHPNVVSGALQGAGSLSTAGSENRLRNAQASTIEQQAGETAYDFQARKRREALMAPIWSALGNGVGKEPNIAPNPYSTAPNTGLG